MHKLRRLPKTTRMDWIVAMLILATGCIRAQTDAASVPSAQRDARVLSAARGLVGQYDKETGLFRGTGWWNTANGITALADASRVVNSREFDAVFANTFVQAQHKFPNFQNDFYDDEGWWALAWVDVYELRHDPRYLKMARSIFTNMTAGWSESCGGGIWWKKNDTYKNAIANELFLSVAAHLAAVTKGAERQRYLDWARKGWLWFRESGMINAQFLINDGLDASCHNNGRTTWTYNQGVILGGLVTMSRLQPNKESLTYARNISTAAMTLLADGNGILHDSCEPRCGDDGVQFKGIFVRNLVSVMALDKTSAIPVFLNRNAVSLWNNARTPDNHFSTVWSGPPSDDKSGALIGALDLLTADDRSATFRTTH